MNKRQLYESIMKNVAKEVKKTLNENGEAMFEEIHNTVDTYEFSLNAPIKNYKALVFAKAVCEPVIYEALKSKYMGASIKTGKIDDDLNGFDMIMTSNGKTLSINAKIYNYKNNCIDLGQNLTALGVVFIINDYLYIIPTKVAKKMAENNILYMDAINRIIESGEGNSKKHRIDGSLATYYESQLHKYISYNQTGSFMDIAKMSLILQPLYFEKYEKYFQMVGK